MSQQTARIVTELHDEPHIEGRRLTVQFIRERVEGRGLSPRTVADRHEIDISDVYHALAYYHDNREEMQKVERERAQTESAYADHTTDPDEVRE